MVQRYVESRLPTITCPDERKHLTDYLYTNAMLPGSGEYCLNKILKPTAFAHKPTLHRIPLLKVKNVAFIHGQRDWMDPTGGVQTMKKCNKLRIEKGKEAAPYVHFTMSTKKLEGISLTPALKETLTEIAREANNERSCSQC